MKQIDEIRTKPEKQELLKKMKLAVWVISAAVLGLVVLMREVKIPLPDGMSLTFLPPFHAFLNSLAAFSLVMALIYIKKKNVVVHQRWIYSAMICSFVFLLSYVAYHFTTPETLYGDLNRDGNLNDNELLKAGSGRKVYLFILLSHIALAALSLPFILLTFCYGFTNHFNKHKKLARKVFPVWLYVAITGPVVYFMLMPYY